MDDIKCSHCDAILSGQEIATYRSRCEDCYAGAVNSNNGLTCRLVKGIKGFSRIGRVGPSNGTGRRIIKKTKGQ
jgi:hypothetical protein